MKLLSSTFFTILLIGFAGVSYGQDIRTINHSDGSVYVGEYKDDQRNGQGTYTYGPRVCTSGLVVCFSNKGE